MSEIRMGKEGLKNVQAIFIQSQSAVFQLPCNI